MTPADRALPARPAGPADVRAESPPVNPAMNQRRPAIWIGPGLAILAACAVVASTGTSPAPLTLVICSPGSPGTSAQAQPTLDAFARAADRAAGRPEGTLHAVYHQTEEAGLSRLAAGDAALAMVPLPFLLSHGEQLSLEPLLEAVPDSGPVETWSLAAKKGSIASAAALDGWEVTGTVGYAEPFVRRTLLARWGTLPSQARITFTPSPLAALRRAASGEKVAVLLDHVQAEAIASLPFAADLEILFRSDPMPSGFLCAVGGRLPEQDRKAYVKALSRMDDGDDGRQALRSMRMSRFKPVDAAALAKLRASTNASRP
jgi:phosphonate ABC transporter substrate-binding protein